MRLEYGIDLFARRNGLLPSIVAVPLGPRACDHISERSERSDIVSLGFPFPVRLFKNRQCVPGFHHRLAHRPGPDQADWRQAGSANSIAELPNFF